MLLLLKQLGTVHYYAMVKECVPMCNNTNKIEFNLKSK